VCVTKNIVWQVCIGVGETEWAFKNTFEVTEEELAAQNVDLIFEGLDTFATAKLVSLSGAFSIRLISLSHDKNGQEILR
jgi:hypothetical protein